MNSSKLLRDDAVAIWQAGVDAVHGARIVERFVSCDQNKICFGNQIFPAENLSKIIVVGFGKASGAMASGLEKRLEKLPDHIAVEGLVCVPDDQLVDTKSIKVVGGRPSGENLPTPRVVETTKKIQKLIRSASPNDICVCLISGGGSALLESPCEPITLEEFRATTRYLSSSGCSIYELNAVRRAMSQVKGGELTANCKAPVVSLILSDVIGDNLDVIASGPTVEPTSELAAIEVLKKFASDRNRIPESVWHVVNSEMDEDSVPRINQQKPTSKQCSNYIIGNIETAMQAALSKATELGYQCEIEKPNGNEGDAETIGRCVPSQIESMIETGPKRCLIQGGESTVKLCEDPGDGGRNQHLILSALGALVGIESPDEPAHNFINNSGLRYCLLSGGTDGEDGTVPVAGAIIDHSDVTNAASSKNDIRLAIQSCNSYQFLKANNCLLTPRKTWTNVCDLRILLTEKSG